VAEPLEPGFGVTLGNALRRVLLSSLTGAAVTSVRIDGVQHEFTVIPHMKEDVTEFLLNVKEVRLRPLSDRPSRLLLEASGEAEVRAGDIQASADYEVVNPELHLATLDSPEARLRVEFTVEPGKGYVPASSADGQPIGTIPVDAFFSPVRQVNFNVERTRVGEATEYERLVLEVWTDGTITPVEAVSRSADILVEQFGLFSRLGREAEPSFAQKAQRLAITPEQYNLPIEVLGLSQRTHNCLKRADIHKVGEVLERTPQQLMTIRHFGEKSWEELEAKLREHGFLPPAQGKAAEEAEAAPTAEEPPEEAEDGP